MPTFYEGGPILETNFEIKKDLYINSLYKNEVSQSLFKRKEVKAGICVAVALLFVVNIPNYKFDSFINPIILAILFFSWAWFYFKTQPGVIMNLYEKKYETNKFLSLSQKATLYRDSMIYENEYEKFSLYYTDFDFCMEDDNVIVLSGAKREFLLINKENFSDDEKEKTSEALKNAFAAKYKRVK